VVGGRVGGLGLFPAQGTKNAFAVRAVSQPIWGPRPLAVNMIARSSRQMRKIRSWQGREAKRLLIKRIFKRPRTRWRRMDFSGDGWSAHLTP